MNTLTEQLRPFALLLSKDAMPKKEFIKRAHIFSQQRNLGRVNLLEMIQFSQAHREGNEVVLD
ncbi:hypothetical protein BH09BAC2_BH09BAC2_08850 [soil metagenome]